MVMPPRLVSIPVLLQELAEAASAERWYARLMPDETVQTVMPPCLVSMPVLVQALVEAASAERLYARSMPGETVHAEARPGAVQQNSLAFPRCIFTSSDELPSTFRLRGLRNTTLR